MHPREPSSDKVVGPRERFNRHELGSSDLENALNDRNLEDFAKDEGRNSTHNMSGSNEIRGDGLDRF